MSEHTVRRSLLTPLLMALQLATVSGLSAAKPNLPVQITLNTYSTAEGEPTVLNGTASQTLAAGESGTLFALVGQMAQSEGSCGFMTSGGHTSRADVTEQIRQRFATALGGDGFSWEIGIEVDAITEAAASLAVTSVRIGGLAGSRERVVTEQSLHLPFGSSRILETVPFTAPSHHATCRATSYQLELEVAPVPIASMADGDLIYELWFARSRDGRREEFAATEILAGQAEEVPFRVPALRRVLPGVRSTQGDEVTLAAQSRGTVRAWSTGPQTLAIQIRPSLHHQLGSPIGTSFSSGEGSKLFTARLGETIELELPEVYTRLTVPAEGITLIDPTVDGIAVVGPGLKLDFHSLLGGARYSLLVRIRTSD